MPMGIINFCIAPSFLIKRDLFGITMGSLFVFLGLYLVYVGYLTWFRFSPLAIRHICGVIAFYLLGVVQVVLDIFVGSQLSVASGIIALFSLIAVICLYCWAFKYYNRLLFGD